jgi:hypothetical protein
MPQPELHAGWIMPLNQLPDYAWVKDGQVVAGGYFDNHGQMPRVP